MTRALFTALVVCSVSSLLAGAEPSSESFEKVRDRARQMGETEEGAAYEKRFSKAFAGAMQVALKDCTKDTTPPYTVDVVFVIGGDGVTQRILYPEAQPVSACVAQKLDGIKVPAPPKPDWLVSVKITISK
jgi:molybdopterin biosynthesis enzyme MoaB